MAAADHHQHSAVFPLSLDEILLGGMVDLTQAQQRKQMSKPFECYGMHWLITIEKQNSDNNQGFDIFVILYCLSVSLGGDDDVDGRACFPIKGEIKIDELARDGLVRSFHAEEGRACNLVGKNFPADALKMANGVVLSLESGATKSDEVEVDLYDTERNVGGYYGSVWEGLGGLVLENHKPESWRDGKSIRVTVLFLGTPRALRYVDQEED